MSVEIQVTCQDCPKEADHAFCDKHLEEIKTDAYNDGKAEGESIGYDKGFEDARAKFEKTEQV